MVLHMENPKNATRKLLVLINEFSKVAGHKLMHRNLLHPYTLAISEREIKKTIPFSIATKRITYSKINLPKEAKDLYKENY